MKKLLLSSKGSRKSYDILRISLLGILIAFTHMSNARVPIQPILSGHDVEVDGIYYILNDTDAYVSYNYSQGGIYMSPYSGDISIPSTITVEDKTYSVTRIWEHAFDGCSELTSIVISNSIVSIYKMAFKDCTGLTNVIVPNSVTTIYGNAFDGCSGLKEPIYNDNIFVRLPETFEGNYTIPSGITFIASDAFKGCSLLTAITIPNSVTMIYDNAFDGCSGLKEPVYNDNIFAKLPETYEGSYTIPSGITSIASDAFAFCTSLTSVSIPESINRIGDSAFKCCANLTNITIPDNVTVINEATFYECDNLKTIRLPVKLTTIEWLAFYGCNSLTDVYCYAATCPVVDNAFYSSSITDATLYVLETSYDVYKATAPWSEFGNIETIDVAVIRLDNTFTAKTVDGLSMRFRITDSVNKTAEVYGYTKKENRVAVYYPAISQYASKATIPSSVYTDKGEYKITRISSYAFTNCQMTSLYIPNSISSMGEWAFYGCTNLQKVIIPDIAAWCSVSFDTSTFNYCSPLYYGQLYSDENTEVKQLTIPESVTHIAQETFRFCWNITEFVLPDGLISIGNDALPFPKYTVGTDIKWHDFHYYCRKGTAGLIAIWNYLENFSHIYSGKVLECQNAYDVNDRTTKLPPPSLSVTTTQTTATIKVSGRYDGYDYTLNYYNSLEEDEIKRSRLEPGFSQNLVLRVTLPNNYSVSYTYAVELKTKDISPSIKDVKQTASSISLRGSYIHGDAIVTKETLAICGSMKKSEYADKTAHCSIYNPDATNRSDYYSNYYLMEGTEPVENNSATFRGLNPSTGCFIIYNVYVGSKPYTAVQYITTDALVLNTLQPKVISKGNVIVAADTNLDDAEDNAGFEWRRYGAPENITPKRGNAYLYEGKMEGYIHDLYTGSDVYWEYRPFYTSNKGNTYYGEWKAVDPADYSYFEPTVHTYASVNVDGNTALIKGYAQHGTDNISSQGFKFWKTENNARTKTNLASSNIPLRANTVEVTGTVMETTLTGLEYETTYNYVSFVTTSEGTFYGEVQSFTTGEDVTGIDEIAVEEKTKAPLIVVARYNMNGQLIASPQKGINIVKYSDGTIKKVMMK